MPKIERALTFDDLSSGRIKLEFGHPEQIAVLDTQQRKWELEHLDQDEETLKKRL